MKLDNLAFQIKLNFQSQESNVFYLRIVYEISEFIVFLLNLKFLFSLFLYKLTKISRRSFSDDLANLSLQPRIFLFSHSKSNSVYVRVLETTEAIPFLVVQPRINLLS